MNRADLLHSVLKDGRTYSRQEIFDRVGFMLTNNAASELRSRGFNVVHDKAGGLDVYRLLDTATPGPELTPPTPSSLTGVAVSSRPTPNPAVEPPVLAGLSADAPPNDDGGDDTGLPVCEGQLQLEVAA